MLWYHYILALIAALAYGNPSQHMTVIGVTGTNGKSTVIELIRTLFESAGFNAASYSSIHAVMNGKEEAHMLKMTMPGRFALQRFLKRAHAEGVTHVVLEATSEGVRQFRHRGIEWDGLVFTNLAPEHIESHGSFEKYRAAKEELFSYLETRSRKGRIPKVIVVNGDDPHAGYFLRHRADKKFMYGLHIRPYELLKETSIFVPSEYVCDTNGIRFTLDGTAFASALQGEFNLYNMLGAIALARAYGIPWHVVEKGIKKTHVIPGRLEFIQHEPFAVVVDYAHTPDALRKVYETLQSVNPKSEARNQKLICVLGAAGGGRDKWKRPEFGKIAAEFCNEIILTNEDPYDESPDSILNEIEAGFSQAQNFNSPAGGKIPNIMKILDRAEAIRKAISDAGAGDTVIITGKGSEQWIAGKNGEMIPWDDREIVRVILVHK